MVGKIRLEFKIEISEIQEFHSIVDTIIHQCPNIMTINTPSQALQHLRDTLRTTQPDIETLINLFSTCLDEIYNEAGPSTSSSEPARKALQRFLPSIQIHILTSTVPNYLHALDDSQVEVLRSFFVPQREAAGIRISRWIALTSYLTLPPFLNAPSTTASIPDLPIPSRTFLLEILDRLNVEYGIDEMYWAVWSGVEEREKGRLGPEELIWEEVTRGLAVIPAKAANAVGRWKSDGWIGDIQERLHPR
jgi:telomere length regulation protein